MSSTTWDCSRVALAIEAFEFGEIAQRAENLVQAFHRFGGPVPRFVERLGCWY